MNTAPTQRQGVAFPAINGDEDLNINSPKREKDDEGRISKKAQKEANRQW